MWNELCVDDRLSAVELRSHPFFSRISKKCLGELLPMAEDLQTGNEGEGKGGDGRKSQKIMMNNIFFKKISIYFEGISRIPMVE